MCLAILAIGGIVKITEAFLYHTVAILYWLMLYRVNIYFQQMCCAFIFVSLFLFFLIFLTKVIQSAVV